MAKEQSQVLEKQQHNASELKFHDHKLQAFQLRWLTDNYKFKKKLNHLKSEKNYFAELSISKIGSEKSRKCTTFPCLSERNETEQSFCSEDIGFPSTMAKIGRNARNLIKIISL